MYLRRVVADVSRVGRPSCQGPIAIFRTGIHGVTGNWVGNASRRTLLTHARAVSDVSTRNAELAGPLAQATTAKATAPPLVPRATPTRMLQFPTPRSWKSGRLDLFDLFLELGRVCGMFHVGGLALLACFCVLTSVGLSWIELV